MDKVATYVRVSNHKNNEFSKQSQIEKLKAYCDEAGYTIKDSVVVIGDRELGYIKLQELLNSAKDSGIEKIVMASINRIVGTRKELDKLAKLFENCDIPIETPDGTYKNGKFIPNFLAEEDEQTNNNEIIDRETWEKVQAKLGEASNESQDEGFTQTLL